MLGAGREPLLCCRAVLCALLTALERVYPALWPGGHALLTAFTVPRQGCQQLAGDVSRESGWREPRKRFPLGAVPRLYCLQPQGAGALVGLATLIEWSGATTPPSGSAPIQATTAVSLPAMAAAPAASEADQHHTSSCSNAFSSPIHNGLL